MESFCSVTEFLLSLFFAERDIIVIRKFLKIKEYYSLVSYRLSIVGIRSVGFIRLTG